jgi:hypothetical protein
MVTPADRLFGQICGGTSESKVFEILERLQFVGKTDLIGFAYEPEGAQGIRSFKGIQLGDLVRDEDSLSFRSDSAWVRLALTGDTEGKIVLGPPGLRQRATRSLEESGGYKFNKDLIGHWSVTSKVGVEGAISVDLQDGCLLLSWLDAVVSIFGTELVIRNDGNGVSMLADGCIAINEPIGDHELQPTLMWQAAEIGPAERYRVEVMREDNVVYTNVTTDAGTTSVTLDTRLRPGTVYKWRVGSENATGDTLRWSESMTFSTAPLNPPRLIAPIQGAQDQDISPVFQWTETPVAVADYYEIEVSAPNSRKYLHVVSSDGTMTVVFVGGERVERGTTTYTFSEELAPDTKYDWRVRAVNHGVASDWSDTWTFRTKASAEADQTREARDRSSTSQGNRADSAITVDARPPDSTATNPTSTYPKVAAQLPGAPTPLSPGVIRRENACGGPAVKADNAYAALKSGPPLLPGQSLRYLPTNKVTKNVGFSVRDRTVTPITDKETVEGLSDLLYEMNTRKWRKFAWGAAVGFGIFTASLIVWDSVRPKPRSSGTLVVTGPN